MKHNIIQTENYLLIVDDSEIKEGDWCYHLEMNDGKIDKCKEITLYHTWTDNGVDKKRKFKKVVAHLPLNNSPILDGVDLLPPLPDEAKDWARAQWSCDPDDYEELYYDGLEKGYNAAKQKYKYTEEDLRIIFYHGVGSGKYQLIDGDDTTGLTSLENFIQNKQKIDYPIEFECEINLSKHNGQFQTKYGIKTIINSEGLTQWVGKYIY